VRSTLIEKLFEKCPGRQLCKIGFSSFNDGCGFSYSTNGGTTWAPESFAPFTSFTTTVK